MTSPELDRLVKIGQLKREPPSRAEIEGLIRSGEVRLDDATNDQLSPESRFDLAYNVAHALALAALRSCGYRSHSRYLVFQTLPHTLGSPPSTWRLLAKCHERRNLAEYEGVVDVDDRLIEALIDATFELLEAISAILLSEPPD